MALYYVYVRLNLASTGDKNLCHYRYILTCASRYQADEYFRAFEERMRLKRISAQFWEYEIEESLWNTITKASNVDSSIYKGIMLSNLPDMGERNGFVQVPAEAGRDWISGRAYFIRNVRQPDIYWYHPAGGEDQILASRWQKTKFFVRLAEADENQTGTVLIRSDRIRISTVSPQAKGKVVRMGEGNRMVMVKPSAASVAVAGSDKDFRFKDLLGSFGTEWECKNGEPYEYVTWGDPSVMHLDDWELC
ncbi:uncharacterized protein H6S33_005285 [Morchella sextelata]|uniref:uncharacterized protein n=1 Tax=Morchella sextelata TaxID=1174677 RepID=UPI001D0575A7|nr:uncharacterized protein H6S33_005285 [Morchella sextelata]KAH0605303.1 hypothetical protein H6S33_005285 [Morchella sextelata]